MSNTNKDGFKKVTIVRTVPRGTESNNETKLIKQYANIRSNKNILIQSAVTKHKIIWTKETVSAKLFWSRLVVIALKFNSEHTKLDWIEEQKLLATTKSLISKPYQKKKF